MTAHFNDTEFACKHCGVALCRPLLQEKLETLRAKIGNKPIQIVSGYRCPVHNKEIGGATDSQHMYASAADIPAGLAKLDVAKACGFTGIGTDGATGWVLHVDVRDGPLATWKY